MSQCLFIPIGFLCCQHRLSSFLLAVITFLFPVLLPGALFAELNVQSNKIAAAAAAWGYCSGFIMQYTGYIPLKTKSNLTLSWVHNTSICFHLNQWAHFLEWKIDSGLTLIAVGFTGTQTLPLLAAGTLTQGISGSERVKKHWVKKGKLNGAELAPTEVKMSHHWQEQNVQVTQTTKRIWPRSLDRVWSTAAPSAPLGESASVQ